MSTPEYVVRTIDYFMETDGMTKVIKRREDNTVDASEGTGATYFRRDLFSARPIFGATYLWREILSA